MNDRTEYEIGCEFLASQYPDRKGEVIFHFHPNVSERFVLKSWPKLVGETVCLGDAIAVLESETHIYEIESYIAGVLVEHMYKCGDVVQPGSTIVRIGNEI